MPFSFHCGKEVSEDVSVCPNCRERLKTGDKSETHSRKRSKVIRFLIGLVVVGAICGVLFVIEQATIPFELRVDIAFVKQAREAPYEVQLAVAREMGITVEELLESPYDAWAPKASIGLLSAYAVAGAIYVASPSSKSSTDRGERA